MATKYVTKAGNDTTGDGSVGNPYLTIAKAITVTSAGDTINLGVGQWDETCAGNAGRSFTGQGMFLTIINGMNIEASTTIMTMTDLKIIYSTSTWPQLGVRSYGGVRAYFDFSLRSDVITAWGGQIGWNSFYNCVFWNPGTAVIRLTDIRNAGTDFILDHCTFYRAPNNAGDLIFSNITLSSASYMKNCISYLNPVNENFGRYDEAGTLYAFQKLGKRTYNMFSNNVASIITSQTGEIWSTSASFIDGLGGDLRLAENSRGIAEGQP